MDSLQFDHDLARDDGDHDDHDHGDGEDDYDGDSSGGLADGRADCS